jgi:hypothetical protein
MDCPWRCGLLEYLWYKFLRVFIAFVFFGIVRILALWVEKGIKAIRSPVSKAGS